MDLPGKIDLHIFWTVLRGCKSLQKISHLYNEGCKDVSR